jgi:hypothetical protein
LAIGDNKEICQKLKIIIGSVVVIADRVNTKLSLIAKNFGKNLNIFA